SIAIASGLLFATLAGISAIGRQEDRAVWVRDVFSRDTIRDASGEKGTHFLAFYEHYISGELYWVAEVKEAANQPALMPGVSSIPEDGQFYASPALIKLMKQLPDDQLRDRLPEQLLGEIEPEGLTGPGQLLAVVGSSADTAGVESVVQ